MLATALFNEYPKILPAGAEIMTAGKSRVNERTPVVPGFRQATVHLLARSPLIVESHLRGRCNIQPDWRSDKTAYFGLPSPLFHMNPGKVMKMDGHLPFTLTENLNPAQIDPNQFWVAGAFHLRGGRDTNQSHTTIGRIRRMQKASVYGTEGKNTVVSTLCPLYIRQRWSESNHLLRDACQNFLQLL